MLRDVREGWSEFTDRAAGTVAYLLTETPLNELLVTGVLTYGVVRAASDGLSLAPGSFSAQVRDLLWVSALCGLAAFATIEVLKRLFSLRAAFQLRATEQWLTNRLASAVRRSMAGQSGKSPDIHLHEEGLIRHYMAGELTKRNPFSQLIDGLGLGHQGDLRDQHRLFGLPPDQLSAQVAAVADIGLADATQYPDLLAALTGEYEEGEWTRVRKDWERYLGLIRAFPEEPKETSTPWEDRRQDPAEVSTSEGEMRRAQRVRSGIDQLQILLTDRWRNNVQLAAIWMAGGFGIGVTYASHVSAHADARYVLAATLLGGVAAWFTRDITAVVERRRQL
jgi:hypothetical protein